MEYTPRRQPDSARRFASALNRAPPSRRALPTEETTIARKGSRCIPVLPAVLLLLAGCTQPPPTEAALKEYLKAQDFYVRGQIEAASAIFARVAKSCPRFHQARLMEAKALYLLGRTEQARQELADVVDRFPRYHEAAIWLARIEVERGDTGAAERRLSELLAYDSQDPRLLYLMAVVRTDQGRLQEAITYLGKAAAFEEEFARVHLDLGRLYHRFALREKAREELSRTLALLPAESPLREPVEELVRRTVEKE